jgi:competence protein ComEA
MKTRSMRNGPARLVTGVALLLVACGVALGAPALAAQADSKAGAGSGAVRQVDLNKASAEELTSIPGIGVALAQRIIEFREKEGPFRRVEDLMKVKGIGEKSFEKMRPHVKVEGKG